MKFFSFLESEHIFLKLESKLTKYAPSGWKDDVCIKPENNNNLWYNYVSVRNFVNEIFEIEV